MTTFRPQQSNRGQCVHQKASASTFDFKSPNAPSICAGTFTKRDKSSASIVTSRCSRTVVGYRLYRVQAEPLSWLRILRLAGNSPMTARSPARRPCDNREMSGKTSGEMSCGNIRATSRQWSGSDSGNAAECPSRRLARQLALRRSQAGGIAPETCGTTRNTVVQQPRAVRAMVKTTSRKTTCSNLYHDIQKS
jgi:hypothetical protein